MKQFSNSQLADLWPVNPGRKAWSPRQVFLKQFEAHSLSNPRSHVGRLAAEYRWNQDGMTGWSIGTWMQMAGKTVKVVELLLKGGRFSMYRYKRASTKTRMWSHPKESIEAFRSLHLEKQIGEGSYGKVPGKVPTLSVFVKAHLIICEGQTHLIICRSIRPSCPLHRQETQKSLDERNGSNLEVTRITAMHFS